ncbi:MAG: hypothetical protein WDO15_12150 [Bacteroidota bacterium]
MKVGNLIDLIAQTIILGVTVLSSLAIVFTGDYDSIAIFVMAGAFFLGPWQFISSLITTFSGQNPIQWRKLHLTSSVIYFIAAGVFFATLVNEPLGDVLTAVIEVFIYGVPAVLAGFYYWITVQTFRQLRSQ